jgi:hypothetical protein
MKTLIAISAILLAFFDVNAQQNLSVSSPCNPVTNLSATYTSDCKAILTWDEPVKSKSDEILWDNTNIPLLGGIISSYWSVSDKWVFVADDFVADKQWLIKKIYSKGASVAPSELPIKFAIVIYLDDAGKPGTEIYRNTEIFVTDGTDPEIIFPEPFELPYVGRYWISIAGTYDADVSTLADINNYRWNIKVFLQSVGVNIHIQDKTGIFFPTDEWVSSLVMEDPSSMYFVIEGERSIEKTEYNIYRDDIKITTIEETSYIDADFDPFTTHTWEVTAVCDDGESEAMSETLEACELTIVPHEYSQTIIYPNPANNLIYIEDETVANINVYNSMGQMVNSYEKVNVVDVSSYKAGIYFFKIATLEDDVKYFKIVVTN